MSREHNAQVAEIQQLLQKFLVDYENTKQLENRELQRVMRRMLRWLIADARKELNDLTRPLAGEPKPR